MRDDIDLDKKLGKLELLWHTRNIPFFHRYYVDKYLFTSYMKNIDALLENQIKLISEETHIYYNIFRTINAREACLRQLKKHLAELAPQDVYEYLHISREYLFN